MPWPTTFAEKKDAAFVWFANAVASEDPNTPNHEKRMAIAKELASGGGRLDWFISKDFLAQQFGDATAAADYQNRLSGIATNIVNLGLV